MNTIALRLFVPEIVRKEQFAALLSELCRHPWSTPAKCDVCEPIRTRLNPKAIGETVDRLFGSTDFYWTGVDRRTTGSIDLRRGQGRKSGGVCIHTAVEAVPGPESMVELAESIVSRLGCTYGYVHCLADQEVELAKLNDTLLGSKSSRIPAQVFVTRRNLVRCLPDLYWANFFGPEYVALFGKETVASAPAPEVRALAHGTYCLKLSGHPLDLIRRYDEMAGVREAVKRHLGSDCFFDYEKRFAGKYRVPALGWEEPVRPPLTFEDVMKMIDPSKVDLAGRSYQIITLKPPAGP